MPLAPRCARLAFLALVAGGTACARVGNDRASGACPPLREAPRSDGTLPPVPDVSGGTADGDGLPPEVRVADPRPWKVIVLHHSASARGGAVRIDEWHRAKGWDGVGYDFVVGNGSDTPDGALETTSRWTGQRDGAHAKGWNDIAIGICLVGNFEDSDPTPAQRETLARLLRHLRGRFSIPAQRVVGHGSVGATLCPGKRFSVRDAVAASEERDPAGAGLSSGGAP